MAKIKPKISIVMPTLNEEKLIERALRSIKNQKNAPEYELIIVDGGSSDDTVKIAKRYTDLIFYEPKRTIAAGRHKGALKASGEIIINVNADCYYKEDWLANLIKPFENPRVIGTFGKLLPDHGELVDHIFAETFLHPSAHILSTVNFHFVSTETLAIKKDEFLRIDGFNTNLICGEDTDLIKRIKKYGKVVYVPSAVVYVSMRRIKKWGRLYYLYFHTTNFVKMHLFNKAHKRYEPIRE
ncbi:MAG: glycosyltransferase [Candidatus Micrarchaeota archaeon]